MELGEGGARMEGVREAELGGAGLRGGGARRAGL